MIKYACKLTDKELSDKEYVKAYISSFNEDYSELLSRANQYRVAAKEEAKFADEYKEKFEDQARGYIEALNICSDTAKRYEQALTEIKLLKDLLNEIYQSGEWFTTAIEFERNIDGYKLYEKVGKALNKI